MTDVVVVRQGREEDVPAALAVWRTASQARTGRPVGPAQEARLRTHAADEGMFLFVAEDGGEIIGMAMGQRGRAQDGAGPAIPGLCHVSAVFVEERRWGRGVGAGLVAGLLEEAEHRGFVRAQLWTAADNERAQRLYEGRGFRRSGREKPDDDDGRPTWHYECPLGGGSLRGIDHVQLAMPAGQEAEAVAFYAGVLGLSVVDKPAHLARKGGCWFGRGAVQVHLGVEERFRPARKAHPALLVDGLPTLVERLRAAGVDVRAEDPLPGFDRVYVDDPFGNRVELLEPVATTMDAR